MSTTKPAKAPAVSGASKRNVPNRLRFEVFKRDGFTCVYCGAKPPGVILHVDHIVALANGGTNDIDNLVTSCSTCNNGKSAVPLSVSATAHTRASALARSKEMAEIEAAYNEWLREQREARTLAAHRLAATWNEDALNGILFLTKSGIGSIEYFLTQLVEEEIRSAMYVAIRRMKAGHFDPKWSQTGRKYLAALDDYDRRFRYFCGICHRTIEKRKAVVS